MPRAARVSGLLDKDFDDSWIVPARPSRPRGASARAGLATGSVAARGASARAGLATGSVAALGAPESQPMSHRTAEAQALLEGAPKPVAAPGSLHSDRLSGSSPGIPGRRTITIRGQVARPASRVPSRTVRERTGTRPDRIAMWAVLLGVLLLLVAATSSHAAVLHALAGSLH